MLWNSLRICIYFKYETGGGDIVGILLFIIVIVENLIIQIWEFQRQLVFFFLMQQYIIIVSLSVFACENEILKIPTKTTTTTIITTTKNKI